MLRPSTVEEAAAAVRDRAGPLRPVGRDSRGDWAGPDPAPVTRLGTARLDRILEHNPGDFTAVVQAGLGLDELQAALGGHGQWLAVDPPGGGTIGGLVATADSGPVRHRYGGLRDLVIGITVVLGDGTVATAGGKVIKNVAGYDLGKLYTGAYGTLGLITSVALRLHPRPTGTVTVRARTDDPHALGRAVLELDRRPLEALGFDVWWDGADGGLLVQLQGLSAAAQAAAVVPHLAGLTDVSLVEDDGPLWTAQRAGQRRPDGVVVKVSGRPTDLPAVIAAARAAGAGLVGRAGLGLSWLRWGPGERLAERVATARAAVAPRATTVLDGASRIADPWPVTDPGALAVMRRVKAQFDPGRTFRPGVGGL